MTTVRKALAALTLALLHPLAHGAGCEAIAQAGTVPLGSDLVRQALQEEGSDCARRLVRAHVGAVAGLTGRDGIDARFALREAVLAVSRDSQLPIEQRLLLVRAATERKDEASSLNPHELQADVTLIVGAGRIFRAQDEIDAWLEALTMAIRIDQGLAPSDRRARWPEIQSVIPEATQQYGYVDRLATLAELTRNDKVLEQLRRSLANIAYYHIEPWRSDEPPGDTVARCRQVLRLTEALSNVDSCYGCVPQWHWRPIMRVGAAYTRLGMREDAVKNTERAITLARSIENPDYRLGQYRYLLLELLIAGYDKEAVVALVAEMRRLAGSLDSPIAKEVRESLPVMIERWKIEPQEQPGHAIRR